MPDIYADATSLGSPKHPL